MSFVAPFPSLSASHQGVYLDSAATASANLNFGVTDRYRCLVACIGWRYVTSGISGCTIGGITAPVICQVANPGGLIASGICAAMVPTGNSGTVTFNVSLFAPGYVGIFLYAIYGMTAATAALTATSIVINPTASLNTPANSFVIGVDSGEGPPTPTESWSGLVKDAAVKPSPFTYSVASQYFADAQNSHTITGILLNSTHSSGAFAVF